MTSLNEICSIISAWIEKPTAQSPTWTLENWETFRFACRVHGIAPLLHEKLKDASWLPTEQQTWLNDQYDFNVQRIAKMHGELKEILAYFAQNNVPLMPLKGSILSANFYAGPGWRPMADLDLLIHAKDFQRATQLLLQLGYEPDVAHWKHTEFSKPENRQVISKTVEHPENPRKLEIHLKCRETFGGPTLDLTDLMWANSSEGELLGERTTLPTEETLWLHLLVHATYHLWQGRGRLIHLVDLSKVVAQLDIPPSMLDRVDARFTYPALAMQKKYLPSSIDNAILAEQRNRVSSTFRQWVDSLDLVNTSYLNPKPQGLYFSKALRFSEGRPREMLQAFRFALLPSLQEIALDHPKLAQSRMPWLAYCLLPVDWAKRVMKKR